MISPRIFLFLVILFTATAGFARAGQRALDIDASAEPIYSAGGQYTATLDQTHNLWRLQPANGQDLIVHTGTCATGNMVPPGVWLLVIGKDGRPELLAPSVTRLPPGSPERISMRACNLAHGHDLAVPQSLLDLLTANTGAIYVSN